MMMRQGDEGSAALSSTGGLTAGTPGRQAARSLDIQPVIARRKASLAWLQPALPGIPLPGRRLTCHGVAVLIISLGELSAFHATHVM